MTTALVKVMGICFLAVVLVAVWTKNLALEQQAISEFPNTSGAQPSKATRVVVLELHDVPNFLYLDERRTFDVRITNLDQKGDYVLLCSLGQKELSRTTHSLANNSTATLTCEIRASEMSVSKRIRVTALFNGAECAVQTINLVDCCADLTRITFDNNHYLDAQRNRTVLVIRPTTDAEYRHCAVLKKWYRDREWKQAPVILSMPAFADSGVNGPLCNEFVVEQLPGRQCITQIYQGDPLGEVFEISKVVPDSGPAILLLCWGFDEASSRIPDSDLIRSMEFLIERSRRKNPQIQFVISTPPPNPARFDPYSAMLRELSKRQHASLLDLNLELTMDAGWKKAFVYEGDTSIQTQNPNADGREKIAQLLAEALK